MIEALTPEVFDYRRGELVFSEECGTKRVGFVLSGECEVRRTRADDTAVILNTLRQNDSFGILSVFSDKDFPTSIFARKSSAVLFFEKQDVLCITQKYPKASLNLINFLTEKLVFLNRKIATYSEGSVEEKLSSFLLSEYKKRGSHFPLNCKRCSEELGVGRASVYRAIDNLAREGTISYFEKQIKIICPEGLERKIK